MKNKRSKNKMLLKRAELAEERVRKLEVDVQILKSLVAMQKHTIQGLEASRLSKYSPLIRDTFNPVLYGAESRLPKSPAEES